jgi:hypothetical protein
MATRRPARAAPIAIPTMAPVERPVDVDGLDVAVADVVALPVDEGVAVMIGGKGRVGGIFIDAHPERSEDRQQNEVALGDVRPQYVHN